MRDAEEATKAVQRQLQEAVAEKNHYKQQTSKLTETLAVSANRRRQEFATIQQTIQEAVSKEFGGSMFIDCSVWSLIYSLLFILLSESLHNSLQISDLEPK